MADFLTRCQRVQEVMAREGIQAFLASPSSDMLYLSGCPLAPSERLTLLVLPKEGRPLFLVPALEAPGLTGLVGGFPVKVWPDSEDTLAPLKEALGEAAGLTVAVSDQLWATFLVQLQQAFPGARFVAGSQLLKGLRMVKSAEEIGFLRRAAAMADRIFERVLSLRLEGLTEAQLSARMAIFMLEEGFQDVRFRIVASGENGAAPHHFPGERRMRRGDAVVLDYGGTYGGYYADVSRTLCLGEASPELRHVYDLVLRAQEAGVQAVRPGVEAWEIDRAARSVIEEAGYGDYFIHRTGHGIGLDVHEEPTIGKGSATILEEGLAFTMEPGVYLPGRFGVRIEDVVVVTSTGAQRLNQAPRELLVV